MPRQTLGAASIKASAAKSHRRGVSGSARAIYAFDMSFSRRAFHFDAADDISAAIDALLPTIHMKRYGADIA